LTPGTSTPKRGSCIFRIDFTKEQNHTSFFLLKLSMPYSKNDLLNLDRGWSGVEELSSEQLEQLKQQKKLCYGNDD